MITAQFRISDAGAGIGGGVISGNSPSVVVYSGNIFFSLKNESWEDFHFKFAFHFAEDYSKLLPESNVNKYYSFMKAITLLLFIEQKLRRNFFLNEGIGLAYLNDRIFPDENKWLVGVSSFVSLGYRFGDEINNVDRYSLTLQFDYASAFSKTASTLTLFTFQVQKYF